jgi:hypothetical protein
MGGGSVGCGGVGKWRCLSCHDAESSRVLYLNRYREIKLGVYNMQERMGSRWLAMGLGGGLKDCFRKGVPVQHEIASQSRFWENYVPVQHEPAIASQNPGESAMPREKGEKGQRPNIG